MYFLINFPAHSQISVPLAASPSSLAAHTALRRPQALPDLFSGRPCEGQRGTSTHTFAVADIFLVLGKWFLLIPVGKTEGSAGTEERGVWGRQGVLSAKTSVVWAERGEWLQGFPRKGSAAAAVGNFWQWKSAGGIFLLKNSNREPSAIINYSL